MKTPKYYSINTAGQVTAVITTDTTTSNLASLAIQIMERDKRVEQVGILSQNSFTMMGGELSINALLAAAYLLNQTGTVNDLSYKVVDSTVSLAFPRSLVLSQTGETVYLRGINYQLISGIPRTKRITNNMRSTLQQLAQDVPAAGLIYYQDNRIVPLVYVAATNTYVWEKACGSGSLAFSLVTGIREVIQPSGQAINYQFNQDNITVTATVKEV